MANAPDDTRPIKPRDQRVRIEQFDDELELRYRTSQIGGALFMSLWLTGWTVGCVLLVRQAILDPTLLTILFATPFVVSWLFVFALLLYMLCGGERLRLSPHGLDYSCRAIVPLAFRQVPLSEIKRAIAGRAATKNNDSPPANVLRIETLGHALDFASGISDKEQRYLVGLVQQHLDLLQQAAADHDSPAALAMAESRAGGDKPLVLKTARMPLEPPSDCSFVMERDFEGCQFVARGRWSLGAICGATFICLFWNGIVGVFICQLFKSFEWGLFLFLLPFEAIGLAFAFFWFYCLTAPAWTLSWKFDRSGVAQRRAGFGIGRTRRTEILSLARIELHPADGVNAAKSNALGSLPAGLTGEYSLALIDPHDDELVEIGSLTEGEARWMADTVMRELPQWFPR